MGRRKKEEPARHRQRISDAAQRLFYQKGIEAASMDEIAAEAGYSKATLYVYFKNKQELVSSLVLQSMELLLEKMEAAVRSGETTRERYHAVCHALAGYQEEFPFYFELVLGEINIDFETRNPLDSEKETYSAGERINETVRGLLEEGIRRGDLRAELPVLPTIFLFWGSLSGLILLAAHKEAYLQQAMSLSRQAFMNYGFETLYRSITAEVTKG